MKIWKDRKSIKCVVLCGGKGSRLFPLSLKKQKAMIRINNKPVIKYIIDYWRKYTDDFVFIVKYKKRELIKYIKTLPIKYCFVEPDELRGIADGLSYAENFIDAHFITVLGDCILKGRFYFPENFNMGIGIWKTDKEDDIKRSYSVYIKEDKVSRVIEKPEVIENNNCGMGFYFFHKKIFKYIKMTKPSSLRNEIEITDVIQKMIDYGEDIKPVFFKGQYLNITYSKDMKTAKNILI